MLTTISKYPFFDLSEIISDNDIPFKPYKALKPVKTGNLRGKYGVEQLKQLNAAQSEIKANGGNLLVLTDEAGDDQLAKITWEHSLSLNFYRDINNEIASKFRVYSENDPTWNRFSGIDVNIPLLAVYVIDTDRHIVYDHVNRDLSNTFIADDIIGAVYNAALTINHRKSA
jgi:peroxiredoxin